MSERLEDFKAEIEVLTYDGQVAAVLYDGRLLAFDTEDVSSGHGASYRELYESGYCLDVLAVEVDGDDDE